MRKNLFIVLCCTTLIACTGNQQESKVVEDNVFQTVKDTIVAECTDTQQTIEVDTPATIKNDIPNTKAKDEDIDISICTSEITPYNNDSSYIDIDIWEEEEYTYMKAEKMPTYKGHFVSVAMNDIAKNFDCAIDSCISGIMVYQFVVNAKGRAVEPIILKSLGNSLYDSCVCNAISKLGTWEPGENKGEKVRVYINSIINFENGLPCQLIDGNWVSENQ